MSLPCIHIYSKFFGKIAKWHCRKPIVGIDSMTINDYSLKEPSNL